ncbi:tyrosyl-DNA phosphodiesterase-domain-containing protein [Aspergillus californicus]
MDSESGDDGLRAADVAALNYTESTDPKQTSSRSTAVVDLTADTTDEDDDVVPIYPKSKSVVSSEADGDASVMDVSDDDNDDDDDDDEAFKMAIALSLQADGQGEPPKPEPASVPEQVQGTEQDETHSTATGFLGLDRKKMEEERLARLAKRKAGGPPAVEPKAKQSRTEPRPSASSIQPKLTSMPSSVPSIQYPTGTVKKTFALGYRRAGDDINIEEVLQKSDLELAVLSSFMWDADWILSKLDVRKSRFIMVMQAKDDATKRQYEADTASMTNLRLCFPPMDGQVNCMHSKLMLLFHPEYLRIAVPTANLVPYDWGEAGGVMENSVFLIDLPKKDRMTQTSEQSTNFYTDLVYFLKATTLHENIIAKLEHFDFSKTGRFAFVHTIGGAHLGNSWKRTGYCGLGRSIDSLGLRTSQPINLDYVTSSLGALTPEFMKCIYLAAQGDTGLTELTLRTAKSFPARNPSDPRSLIQQSTADEWKDNRVRIYFPSYETILRSKGGPNAAGTICFQSKWLDNGKFPKHALRDCFSAREGLVMHNKILYVQPDEPFFLAEKTQCLGWAYVGSANLSESAWGRLVHDRTTKQPKLNCRNWECGVVIPILKNSPEDFGPKHEDIDSDSDLINPLSVSGMEKGKKVARGEVKEDAHLDIFRNTVPVPMHLPGKKYEGARDLKPWYFMEAMY